MPGWDDADRRDEALARILARVLQPAPLSQHELAAVFLASHGVEFKQAALMLHLSPHTVRGNHRKARAKLDAANLTHTVATALRLGLID
jgi:DNA-binding CsgD family transcriptional regulator